LGEEPSRTHSSIFFFSHPSCVLTQCSPGERQSFDIKGIIISKIAKLEPFDGKKYIEIVDF